MFDPREIGSKNQQGSVATRYGTRSSLTRLVAVRMPAISTSVSISFCISAAARMAAPACFDTSVRTGQTLNGRHSTSPGRFRGVPPDDLPDDDVPSPPNDFPFGRELSYQRCRPPRITIEDALDFGEWVFRTTGADGRTSTYLAGSNEIASPQSPRPSGGMPGWSITLAANNRTDAIIIAMLPYKDSNMLISPGRFLVYDAQNFATNPDGSKRLQVIWDSENWGPEHAFMHPKFNRPIVWKGRIYRPTYNGQLDVYGLTN
ncbi:hypothetical protein ACVWYH_002664 [Bradyrhizobium sp. GM24.11]